MKKFLSVVVVFVISAISVFAADLRFVQVEGAKYSPDDEASVSRFENIIKDINKQKNISFVVFSGNNISKPNKEYLKSFLKAANKLNAQYYVIMGSKDINKQKNFGKAAYIKELKKHAKAHSGIKSANYVFTKKKVVFVVADGSKEVIPLPNGYYKPEVIEWVNEELNKYNNKNVVILQHYPLIPPTANESRYTYKAEEYLKMLSNHKNVKAIVAGNFGVNDEKTVGEIVHISTADAPQYRIIDIIDCDTQNPTFWSSIK